VTEYLICSVDPGKLCGVAVRVPGRPPTLHRVRGNRLADVARIVMSLRALADEKGVRPVVVIENQFGAMRSGRDGKPSINLKGLATLYRRRHEWEILCQLYGIEVETVWPSTWQTQLKQVPPHNPDGSKRSTKAKSLHLAARKWPTIFDWTEDTADAALIGEWYRMELMRKGELLF